MAQNILIGCIPDWLQQSGASVTAESEVASLPDDNLLDTSIAKVWRSSGTRNSAGVAFDLGQVRSAEALAAVNHNLRGEDYFLLSWSQSNALTGLTIERVLPNGDTPSTGGYGHGTDYTDVDDDIDDTATAVDTDYLGVQSPSGTDNVVFDFATPSASPTTGTGLQCFRIRLGAFGHSSADITIGIKLAEATTVKQDLGTFSVSWDGSYYNVHAFWDASNLGTANGSAVQCEVEVLTATDPDGINVSTVDWVCVHSAPATLETAGWVQVADEPTSFGGSALATISDRSFIRTQSHIFTTSGAIAAEELRYGRLDFITTRHPDGYVEIGRLAIGGSFYGQQLLDNFRPGLTDLTTQRRSKGGQLWRRAKPVFRTASLPLQGNQSDILRDIYNALYRALGSTGDFLISIFPDTTADLPILSFWATLPAGDRDIEGASGVLTAGDDAIWETTMRVEEVL